MEKAFAKALIGLCIDEGLKQGVLKNKGEFEELLDYLDKCFTDTGKMTSGSSEISNDLEEAANVYSNCYSNPDGALAKAARRAYITGAKWDREQMMKEAVDGYISFNENAHEEGLPDITAIADEKPLEFYEKRGFKLGDKVRVIVLKKED